MILGSTRARGIWMAVALAAVVALACDKDPNQPDVDALVPRLLSDSVIPIQGSIRVFFNVPINRESALDPSNFVVTNACNGLQVPGSVRLSGDTLIFSPSEALPFLTALSIRVQGVLDVHNNALPQPLIFRVRTENPPVSDVSWQQLPSPTNDAITGVTFISRDLGYVSTLPGGVYRTINGGSTYGAQFKRADITSVRDIRSVSTDSLYMVGAISIPGSTVPNNGLLRSIDGGLTFQPLFQRAPSFMLSLALRDRTGQAPEMVIAGGTSSMTMWRYDEQTDSVFTAGPVTGDLGLMADLSPNGANAVAVGVLRNPTTGATTGVVYTSSDGGRTYPTQLPNTPQRLNGVGFINNTEALLLGDTSLVSRLDVTTGAVTVLGANEGIPQSEVNVNANISTHYFFNRAVFAPDDRNIGWVIGSLVRRIPGLPDVRRGIILITRDGGRHFTRQAVQGAPSNGVDFSPLRDIFALNKNFVVTVGDDGFIAARKSDTQNFATVCSFPSNP